MFARANQYKADNNDEEDSIVLEKCVGVWEGKFIHHMFSVVPCPQNMFTWIDVLVCHGGRRRRRGHHQQQCGRGHNQDSSRCIHLAIKLDAPSCIFTKEPLCKHTQYAQTQGPRLSTARRRELTFCSGRWLDSK